MKTPDPGLNQNEAADGPKCAALKLLASLLGQLIIAT
jgi:hypothetical protein